ncbi:MAG: peptide chain release factor N(5)-glutamine methyltransferase [Parafilimonas sp.]
MTILQAAKNLSVQLMQLYDDREAIKIADMIMEKTTGLSRTERLINKELLLTETQQHQLQDFTKQLLQHTPIQYVLHEAWFVGMKYYVDEHVLIPRTETEELVEVVLSEISNENLSILDIGTGSGCIAISLKKKLPTLDCYALDISDEALNIAQKNAIKNNVEIKFFQANILNFKTDKPLPLFDIIVSNPPYIKQNEASEMHPNVLLFEPQLALFVPDNDPLFFYKAISDFSLQNLKAGSGKLYVEINEMMGEKVKALFEEKGFIKVKIKKDIQGKERIVSASIK